MSTPAAVTHHGFISTSNVRKTGVDWPDIQMYFLGMSTYSQEHKDLSWIFKFEEKYFKSILDPVQGLNTFAIGPTLVRPKSVGEIRLRDDNPSSPPVIDPRYLEHPDDVKALQEGLIIEPTLYQANNKIGYSIPLFCVHYLTQQFNCHWIWWRKRAHLRS